MKFKLNKDEIELIFEDEEIEVIKKEKKIIMDKLFFKHFANVMMGMIAQIHESLPEDIKNKQSYLDEKGNIIG